MAVSHSYTVAAQRKLRQELALRVEALTLEAHSLIDEFNRQFPRGRRPAYLAMNPDGSLTAMRWRLSGGSNPRFELWDTDGKAVRQQLPELAWPVWLGFEERRQDLNHQLAVALYELQRVSKWLEQRGHVTRLRESVGNDVPF